MKRKYLYLFICSIILVFVLSLSVFANGTLPDVNSPGVESYNIVPESIHNLTDVDVVLSLLNDGYSVVTFSINYYLIDYEAFFESGENYFTEYMGWQTQLETSGTWLNTLVYHDTFTYSNWFDFALILNEALYYSKQTYLLSLENSILAQENADNSSYISELETRIEQLENDLADGGNWQDGYNAGINDGESVSNGIMTVFTAPLTFLSGWFNFTIFGINFASLIKFFVSLALVAWLFKKLKTESE